MDKVRPSSLDPDTYICPRCGEAFTLEAFFYKTNKNNTIEIYWQGCKDCYRAYRKELRNRVKEKNPLNELTSVKLKREITRIRKESKWDTLIPNLKKALKSIFPECEYINSGLDRIVFSIGNYVVKIDRHGGSSGQNKNEVENYRKIKRQSKDIQKYFLPIIAYDKNHYDWIIMPKAKVVDSSRRKVNSNKGLSWIEADKIEEKISKALYKAGARISDLHSSNIGEYKGQGVVIDYGFPLKFRGK